MLPSHFIDRTRLQASLVGSLQSNLVITAHADGTGQEKKEGKKQTKTATVLSASETGSKSKMSYTKGSLPPETQTLMEEIWVERFLIATTRQAG